jgi:hypothetical protein
MSQLVREHLLAMKHLPDEHENLEPEWNMLTDGKMTISIITTSIHNDTIVPFKKFRIKTTLKINRVCTDKTFKCNFLNILHFLYLFSLQR